MQQRNKLNNASPNVTFVLVIQQYLTEHCSTDLYW